MPWSTKLGKRLTRIAKNISNRELESGLLFDDELVFINKHYPPIVHPLHDFGRRPKHFRELFGSMKKWLVKFTGKKICQLGSSSGVFMRILQSKGAHSISIDRNPRAAIYYRKKFRGKSGIVANSKEIPIASKSLDAVVSDHFLFAYYINPVENEAVLAEANRVLKPGGFLFLERVKETRFISENLGILGFELVEITPPALITATGEKEKYSLIVARKKIHIGPS